MKTALIMGVLFIAAATARAQPMREFITSYWYGPPAKFTSLETYQRIRDANFNVVFPPGPPDASLTRQQNIDILDICHKLGLKAVVYDPRMPRAISGVADAKNKIDAIVADYSSHPALLAYFIVDEPSAKDFAALGEVVAYLKERDPAHPGYINLFPTYAAPWAQLGTQTYEQYLDQFISAVEPFVISFDHYPFIKGYDRPDFLLNLAHVRNAAVSSNRPFWNIVQCVQHYDYRRLTEPEMRYMAMQTLAFGGRGLLWYTYWYPGEPSDKVTHAMIKFDGAPDEPYEWIRQINADARLLGSELLDARSWATFQVGPNAQYAMPQGCPIRASAGNVSIGVFKRQDGKTLALITNRDYTAPTTARLHIDTTGNTLSTLDPHQRDPKLRQWQPHVRRAGEGHIEAILPPGGAVLLRW